MITHQPYPGDVADAEWAFVAPYLCLMPEDAGQRVYNLRAVYDGLRWIVRAGATSNEEDWPSKVVEPNPSRALGVTSRR